MNNKEIRRIPRCICK